MAKASLPLALLTILVFYPPVNKVSAINLLWLFITLILFYIAFTFYVTPYNEKEVLDTTKTDK
jgi:GPH family glycoside/pentoside/hexuronide:cation symporter